MFISQILKYDLVKKLIECCGIYKCEGDAYREIDDIVLQYIIKFEGEKHKDVAIQTNSDKELLSDGNLKPGLYAIKNKEHASIVYYMFEKKEIPGYLWGSGYTVDEVALFFIITYEIDGNEKPTIYPANSATKIKNFKNEIKSKCENINYITQINEILKNVDSEFGLSPSKLAYKKTTYKKGNIAQ